MTSEQRNGIREYAKKNKTSLDLAALNFLDIDPVDVDGSPSVPEGNKGAVYNIVWELENVKD